MKTPTDRYFAALLKRARAGAMEKALARGDADGTAMRSTAFLLRLCLSQNDQFRKLAFGECADLLDNEQDIEAEADKFASTLLMPLDDFRKQVDGQPVTFDLLGHCADRYGVSLTAAALRWTEIAEKRAVLVASRDDHLLWAKSNQAAFKSGAYFATRKQTIELPQDALAHSNNLLDAAAQLQSTRAQTWFPREPVTMQLTEMTLVACQYDYTLTLLLMPDAEWQRPQHDDEEAEEDTYDRFIRAGQYPVR